MGNSSRHQPAVMRRRALPRTRVRPKAPRNQHEATGNIERMKRSAKYKKLRSPRSSARLLLYFAAKNVAPTPTTSAPVDAAGSISAKKPNPLPRRSACVGKCKSGARS